MFGTDTRMIQAFGFTRGDLERFLSAWCERDHCSRCSNGLSGNKLFDFVPDSARLGLSGLQHGEKSPLGQFKHTKQNMFGADEIVSKPRSFFAGNLQGSLGDA